MPIFGWIRDALGLHKDIIDSKKSKLEVDKLEDEKLGRELITRATLKDVKEYDPKVQLLERKIELEENELRQRRDNPPAGLPLEKLRKLEDPFAWTMLVLSFVILFLMIIISHSC